MSRERHTQGMAQRWFTRREFLVAASASAMASSWLLTGCGSVGKTAAIRKIESSGPASRYVARAHVAFVRRKGEYGISWPGAVYDGEAARVRYTAQIAAEADRLRMNLDLRPAPIYSAQEADAWIQAARDAKPDGLLVVLLDRQQHAWATAEKAIDSGIATVVFSPVGSSFTTNTARPSRKSGCFICSTDDFNQVRYGMKMLQAAARLRATRCVVIKGTETREAEIRDLGITLRYVPAQVFLEEYQKTPVNDEILALANDYIARAVRMVGATKEDVINGVKSYVVARTILEREQGDAITMDCLGALGKTKVSLPCIAWSRMNDDGIPAACEADLGAVAAHPIVQYLFDRPGFQQDPVAETARTAIIGAHCSCPTRLNGFSRPPEPFELRHHHGNRDAIPRTLWRLGQRITCLDVGLSRKEGEPTKMLISTGEVIENVSVPPAGGCVVSVMVKFDGVEDVLAFPGFHQIFFYGDCKRELLQFCRLLRLEPTVI